MKPLESYGQPQEHSIDAVGSEEKYKGIVREERNRFSERLAKSSGKARALLAVFLLSTNTAYAAEISKGNGHDILEEAWRSPDLLSNSSSDFAVDPVPKMAEHKALPYTVLSEAESRFERNHVIIHYEADILWALEHVRKVSPNGQNFYAQRYLKYDRDSGDIVVLGEYDDVFQTAEGVSSLEGIPEEVKQWSRQGMEAVQMVRKTDAALMEHGFLKLPNGKHGTVVPNSERKYGDRILHKEVRRTYDEHFDMIAIWEIDDEGNEVDYSTTDKGSTEYEKFLAIIEASKSSK